jgi:hypothetical protein
MAAMTVIIVIGVTQTWFRELLFCRLKTRRALESSVGCSA